MSALSVHSPRDMAFTATAALGPSSSASEARVGLRVSHNDHL